MIADALQPASIASEAPRLAARASVSSASNATPSAASLFGSRLDQARTGGGTEKEQLRELTEMLVSTAFIAPMFERMRSDPLAANLFHGGRAEDIFQQQLDQVYADRIAGTTRMGLAEAIYNQLARENPTGQTLNTDA